MNQTDVIESEVNHNTMDDDMSEGLNGDFQYTSEKLCGEIVIEDSTCNDVQPFDEKSRQNKRKRDTKQNKHDVDRKSVKRTSNKPGNYSTEQEENKNSNPEESVDYIVAEEQRKEKQVVPLFSAKSVQALYKSKLDDHEQNTNRRKPGDNVTEKGVEAVLQKFPKTKFT